MIPAAIEASFKVTASRVVSAGWAMARLQPCGRSVFVQFMLKRFPDRAIVRFSPGMLARLDAVLKPGEDRAAFILAATAAALRKAERETDRQSDAR